MTEIKETKEQIDEQMRLSAKYNNYKANPIELAWRNLDIIADMPDPKAKKCTKKPMIKKTIINKSEGVLRPGTFTAILGPSGSGKTTLLNFLSGRLASPNLNISGELLLNGQHIKDIDEYSSQIAYVMQDDILLPTFTPREAFMFVANLRLPHLTHQEKVEKVDNLIQELGLNECSNTKIGNELIRGISGGERKRTSIGVELLTNPSMIFLDEPTTGLDSSTAQQVVQLLKHLASTKGVNIVSTIHQPSSEIFAEFERLILLVRGNLIYQGGAGVALDYFEKIGFQCPPYSNPSDYFMKLMNEEGLMIEKMQKGEQLPPDEQVNKEFEERMTLMIQEYNKSEMRQQLGNKEQKVLSKDNLTNVGVCMQFFLLFKRAFITEIRNPMDFRLKTMQNVVFAIACLIVFNDLGDEGYAAIQNRNGALFFIITQQAFGSIQGSLATFSQERALFLRERQNKSYGTGAYYWGKSLAEFPFHLIYPTVGVCIIYFGIGLSTEQWYQFPILILICILTFWAGASYGLMISILVPQMELAMALIPVVIIPLMVLGGFFVNTNNIPVYLQWIEYISMFKWGFQAAAINEFTDGQEFNCGCIPFVEGDQQYLLLQQKTGTPYGECVPVECDPLEEHGFSETLQETMWILFFLGLAIRLLTVIGMYIISNPRRPKLITPASVQKENTNNKQIQQAAQ